MTKIEWTDTTWNPIVGCSVISPGCTNCYAMRMAARLEKMGQAKYAGLTTPSKAGPVWTGKVRLDEKALIQPLSWVRSRRVFVNSMSDLFHESCKEQWIDKVFAIMLNTQHHTYQVLTKRPERMRVYTNAYDNPYPAGLPNIWLGTSVENQSCADDRIPHLLETQARIRFLSCEPLLGPVYLTPYLATGLIHWVIVGGESGPSARPMHPDWVRGLRDQCLAAGVPFFFKQWGEYQPQFPCYPCEYGLDGELYDCAGRDFPNEGVLYWDGHFYDGLANQPHINRGAYWIERVGKKTAGRQLDGREWNEFPKVP